MKRIGTRIDGIDGMKEKAVDLHFRIWSPILFIPSIPVQIRLCG